jgi:hypothetical protein
MRKLHLTIIVAAISVGSPADACRAYRSPEQMVADGYRGGSISAVALVEIDSAKHTRSPIGDAHPWSASARVERVLRGSYSAQNIVFERGWGSAACQEAHPLPKAGDRWVVYFWRRTERDHAVWATYPFDVAVSADPSLSLLSNGH